MTNMTNLAKEYNNDLEVVKKKLKSVQSQKCRMKKQKGRTNHKSLMDDIVLNEQKLKDIIQYLEPKKQFVTKMSKNDIEQLNYDETIKSIKSIQSKKCLSQHIEDKVEYNESLRIEEMLLNHKKNVKPIEESVVKKSTINEFKNHIETLDTKVSKKYIVELLEQILKDESKF